MALQNETHARNGAIEQEVELLQKYGLRWSVLAAWRDALELRHVAVAPETDRALEKARMKLASGCFNVCEVGCDLQTVVGALISADSSTDHHWVDFWIDLLGHSMTDMAVTEQLLKIPAIRFRYANCGIKGCVCD
jgi:hypothetical protein